MQTGTAADDAARERILVIEDESLVRTVGRRMLESAGYAVTEACDGPEGISAYRTDPDGWSCVLLDVTLPTLGGPAVIEAIRLGGRATPVVICSGCDEEEVSDLLALARVSFVGKPFAKAVLLGAVRDAIRRTAAVG